MTISNIAMRMRDPKFDASTLSRRDRMDAIGSVLSYVSGQWYKLEYGCSEDQHYKRAMHFMEHHYGQAAREFRAEEGETI